jgi:hypothetical protein
MVLFQWKQKAVLLYKVIFYHGVDADENLVPYVKIFPKIPIKYSSFNHVNCNKDS